MAKGVNDSIIVVLIHACMEDFVKMPMVTLHANADRDGLDRSVKHVIFATHHHA